MQIPAVPVELNIPGVPVITRKLEFDAGHRIVGHESKCAHLHGHRYVAEISCQAMKLDNVGRVIDFSVIKREVGSWIDEHWDHNFIFNPNDPLLKQIMIDDHKAKMSAPKGSVASTNLVSSVVFADKTPFIMPKGLENPTAENMVQVLFNHALGLLLPYSVSVVQVKLYETPNSWAIWPPPKS